MISPTGGGKQQQRALPLLMPTHQHQTEGESTRHEGLSHVDRENPAHHVASSPSLRRSRAGLADDQLFAASLPASFAPPPVSSSGPVRTGGDDTGGPNLRPADACWETTPSSTSPHPPMTAEARQSRNPRMEHREGDSSPRFNQSFAGSPTSICRGDSKRSVVAMAPVFSGNSSLRQGWRSITSDPRATIHSPVSSPPPSQQSANPNSGTERAKSLTGSPRHHNHITSHSGAASRLNRIISEREPSVGLSEPQPPAGGTVEISFPLPDGTASAAGEEEEESVPFWEPLPVEHCSSPSPAPIPPVSANTNAPPPRHVQLPESPQQSGAGEPHRQAQLHDMWETDADAPPQAKSSPSPKSILKVTPSFARSPTAGGAESQPREIPQPHPPLVAMDSVESSLNQQPPTVGASRTPFFYGNCTSPSMMNRSIRTNFTTASNVAVVHEEDATPLTHHRFPGAEAQQTHVLGHSKTVQPNRMSVPQHSPSPNSSWAKEVALVIPPEKVGRTQVPAGSPQLMRHSYNTAGHSEEKQPQEPTSPIVNEYDEEVEELHRLVEKTRPRSPAGYRTAQPERATWWVEHSPALYRGSYGYEGEEYDDGWNTWLQHFQRRHADELPSCQCCFTLGLKACRVQQWLHEWEPEIDNDDAAPL